MKVVWNLKWRKALSAFIIGICLIILPKVPLSAAAAEGTEGPEGGDLQGGGHFA